MSDKSENRGFTIDAGKTLDNIHYSELVVDESGSLVKRWEITGLSNIENDGVKKHFNLTVEFDDSCVIADIVKELFEKSKIAHRGSGKTKLNRWKSIADGSKQRYIISHRVPSGKKLNPMVEAVKVITAGNMGLVDNYPAEFQPELLNAIDAITTASAAMKK